MRSRTQQSFPLYAFAAGLAFIAFLDVFVSVEVSVKNVRQEAAIVAPVAVQESAVAHLKIPSINVDAVIRNMGLTSVGAMAVPGNRIDVGWYRLGTRPGQMGSAVIGGHNRWDNQVAVFDRLHELKLGDVMSVVDTEGVSTSFVVREMRTYDASDSAADIFESPSGAHLNMITCSGVWDASTESYTQRLVIFSDRVRKALQLLAKK